MSHVEAPWVVFFGYNANYPPLRCFLPHPQYRPAHWIDDEGRRKYGVEGLERDFIFPTISGKSLSRFPAGGSRALGGTFYLLKIKSLRMTTRVKAYEEL
jgi:hypothetical protein